MENLIVFFRVLLIIRQYIEKFQLITNDNPLDEKQVQE